MLLGEASDGYEYDGQTGTFCVEPFQAGEAVTLDVSYVVSKANQNFPPDDIYGIGTWGDPEASYVIGAYSAPFFPATWMLAPNTMPWIDAAHNRRCRSGSAERGHRRRWGAAEKKNSVALPKGVNVANAALTMTSAPTSPVWSARRWEIRFPSRR